MIVFFRYSFLLTGIILCFSSCNTSIENKIKRALADEKKGNYKSALNQINKAINTDSSMSLLFVIRGRIKSYLKEDYSAIHDFSTAISIDPQNTSAYYQKAISFSLLNQDDSAIKNYNSAIKTKEKGDFYFEKTKHVEIGIDWQSDVDMELIRFNRGISFYELKQDSLAIADFYYSLGHKYKEAESQLYIGVILVNQGNGKGCTYLKYALENGEKRALDYLDKFCRR